MHIITSENSDEAADAIRDIMMMYLDMASAYEGFGHAVTVFIRFDPVKFIDASSDQKAYYVDMELLRTGSAIAILCELYDLWLEENDPGSNEAYQVAIKVGKLSQWPDIETVAKEALTRGCMPLNDDWFDESVAPIYRKYVLNFFKALSEKDRYAAIEP